MDDEAIANGIRKALQDGRVRATLRDLIAKGVLTGGVFLLVLGGVCGAILTSGCSSEPEGGATCGDVAAEVEDACATYPQTWQQCDYGCGEQYNACRDADPDDMECTPTYQACQEPCWAMREQGRACVMDTLREHGEAGPCDDDFTGTSPYSDTECVTPRGYQALAVYSWCVEGPVSSHCDPASNPGNNCEVFCDDARAECP